MSLCIQYIERDENGRRFVVHYTGKNKKLFFSYSSLREFAADFLVQKETIDLVKALPDFIEKLSSCCKSSEFTSSERAIQRDNVARFVTWGWRATRAYHKDKKREESSKELTESLKELIETTAYDLEIDSTGAVFRLRPDGLSSEITLPLDPEESVFLFSRWWRAAEKDMRLIVEELWKHLHEANDKLTPFQKEKLASCFIMALNQQKFDYIRSDPELSWHYCYWHKLRWQAAKQLTDENKLEQDTVKWLFLCYREDNRETDREIAIDTEIDPEREIKNVLFGGDNGIPYFLKRRDKEKQTLFRLAEWFARRYDWLHAFKIVGTPYLLLVFTLSIIVILEFGIVRWLLGDKLIWSIIGVVCLLPYLAYIIHSYIRKKEGTAGRLVGIARLMGRLVGGCVIGWIPMIAGESWRLALINPADHWWVYLVPSVFIIATGAYISLEARNPIGKQLFRRTIAVLALGLLISLAIGIPVVILGSHSILSSLFVKGSATSNCPSLFLGFLGVGKGIWFNHGEPVFSVSVLTFGTTFALFIGIFTQILWEKYPLTEPI